jgi:hypothetical protein
MCIKRCSALLYETFIDRSTHLGSMVVALKHIPCDVPEDHELMQMKNKIIQNLG